MKADGKFLLALKTSVKHFENLEEYEIKSKERINGKIVRSSKTYNFENKILKNIGLMIFDECHLYVSKQYKQMHIY